MWNFKSFVCLLFVKMPVSLAGKVALITGGSAGLGACIAQKLAAQGCNVAINYSSSSERAEALVSQLSSTYNVKAVKVQGDVSQNETCRNIVQETVSLLGGLDIVISNAGWTRMIAFNDLEAIEDEDLDRCYSMNVKSHFYLFRAAKPHFDKNAEGGSFIITSSSAGLKPSGSSMPYSFTKASAVHLGKCLAKTFGPQSRVNVVAPGLLLTEWGLKFGPERIKHVENLLPLKHTPELEDAADAYVSIAKSNSMTGSVVSVDCGMAIV